MLGLVRKGVVIQFASDEEFQRLLAGLAREVMDAAIHWGLYSDLRKEVEIFSQEFNQSATFWSLTFQAHVDATIFRLIRIYDGNSKSLSLPNLLDTIKAKLNIFEEERFRERLRNNPFVDSLATDIRKPDPNQLDTDIRFSGNQNPLVKKLTIWRNNLFAHRSAELTARGQNIAADHSIVGEEVDELVVKATEILNRYSSLFHATTRSTKIIGHDDYGFVLKLIRKVTAQVTRKSIVFPTVKDG